MDYSTYNKAISALHTWRGETKSANYQYPDSRDPAFQKALLINQATAQDFETAIVCLCCWREMRSYLYRGMIAIAHVIHNRAKAGWFHGNEYQNVIAENQFSSMTIHNDPQLVKYPEQFDLQFEKLLVNVCAAMDEELVDPTNGAMYYAALAHANSPWFLNLIKDKKEHPLVFQLGNTTFYK